MRDCDRMRDELKAYVDRELSPIRRWSVARHLATCDACRAEAKEMAQITEEIRPDETETLDPALRTRFIEEVSAAAPGPPQQSTVRMRNWALAGVLLLSFGIFSTRFMGGTASNKLNTVAGNVASSDGGVEVASGSVSAPDDNESYTQTYTTSPSASNATLPPGGSGGYPGADHKDVVKIVKVPVTPPARMAAKAASGGDDEDLGRKVHKSASLTLQVADPEARSEQIEEMVKAAGGFMTNSSLVTDPEGVKTAELTVKVPLPQFEESLAQIAKLGNVQAKNVTGEDITQKVSDADQRANVLEQDMAEALNQLKKKGSKASWDLQEDARDLRIQLAQSRARLRILKSLAELSEIDITLSQPAKSAPPVQTGFVAEMGANGRGAVKSALGAVETLVAFILWILAYAPLWIPAFLVGRWAWKKYQKSAVNAT